ncbi:MAG: amino acid permease [Natrialbaceae archaeon]|nr:amino acid permease [Natrialbaceae archaeon]
MGGGPRRTGRHCGAFTTINTLYTSYSRQIMRAARDETIPFYFAKIHPRFQTPHRAIMLISFPALLIVPFTPSPTRSDPFAVALAALFGSTISAFALWNLPKRFPLRYEHSIYKLPLPVLKGVAVIGFLISGTYLLLASTADTVVSLILAIWILIAIPVFRYRVNSLEEKGIDLLDRMKDLHTHEHERADKGTGLSDED